MKLLIADDSKFIRESLKQKVEAFDLELFEAKDMEEAVSMYKAKSPDLVFMDIMMKRTNDGVVAIRNIKKINPDARIVVITSLGSNDPLLIEAVSLGVIDVITKPFQREELYKFIDPGEKFKSAFE